MKKAEIRRIQCEEVCQAKTHGRLTVCGEKSKKERKANEWDRIELSVKRDQWVTAKHIRHSA
jgi:hypothetical protein